MDEDGAVSPSTRRLSGVRRILVSLDPRQGPNRPEPERQRHPELLASMPLRTRLAGRFVSYWGRGDYQMRRRKGRFGATCGPFEVVRTLALVGLALGGISALVLPGSLANPAPVPITVRGLASGELPAGRDWVRVSVVIQAGSLPAPTGGKYGCNRCALYIARDPSSGSEIVIRYGGVPTTIGAPIVVTGLVQSLPTEWRDWAVAQGGGADLNRSVLLDTTQGHADAATLIILALLPWPFALFFAIGFRGGWVKFVPLRTLPYLGPRSEEAAAATTVWVTGRAPLEPALEGKLIGVRDGLAEILPLPQSDVTDVRYALTDYRGRWTTTIAGSDIASVTAGTVLLVRGEQPGLKLALAPVGFVTLAFQTEAERNALLQDIVGKLGWSRASHLDSFLSTH